MLTILITTLAISFTIIEPVSAIECYNCESVSEGNCGEDFGVEEHFKIDCDQVAPPRYLSNGLDYLNATACMKKIYKEHKILKYVRSCFFGNVNETKIGCDTDPTVMDFQDVQCFICNNENLCNGAFGRNEPQYFFSFILIFYTFKFLK